MTDVDDWSEPYHDREPDPSDYAEQKDEEAYWEHYDQVHGGQQCTCPLQARWGIRPAAPAVGQRLPSRRGTAGLLGSAPPRPSGR